MKTLEIIRCLLEAIDIVSYEALQPEDSEYNCWMSELDCKLALTNQLEKIEELLTFIKEGE